MVKDQLVSGNETSPGCFSTGGTTIGGSIEVSGGGLVIVVPPVLLLFLFSTPAGRPRFFVDEVLLSGMRFAEDLFDSIIFELKLSVITHELILQIKEQY